MSALTQFDSDVSELMALGFSREVAESRVRLQSSMTVAFAQVRDERILEKTEQVEIRKVAIAYGFRVRNLSQYRPSKVALGFADLFLSHARLPVALFWESKRQVGGKRSLTQIEFADDCIRCGVGYGSGDRYAFVEKLIDLEIAVHGAGQYGIEPVRLAVTA